MILLVVFIPILFVMLVWVSVSVYRILRPDNPGPLPLFDRKTLVYFSTEREPAMVGARSIRERGRRGNRIRSVTSPYDYLSGQSDGFPEAWWQDVVERRN